MEVFLLPLARAELDAAFSLYEKKSNGLGFEFFKEYERSIKLILTFPFAFEQVSNNFRRAFIKRFPYSIIYGIDNEQIIIIAITHLKRKPKYWIHRKIT